MGLRMFWIQLGAVPTLWLAWLYMQQDQVIYHPRSYRHPLQPDNFLASGLDVRELHFATEDGNQSAILLKPGPGKTARIYTVFGGNAMVARNWVEIIMEFADPSWNDLAFVLVDYPGYGHSAGSPSQASIGRASKQALVKATEALAGTTTEVLKFGALGHSIGCAAALQLATATRTTSLALQHVVISAPFTSLAEEAHEMLPILRFIPTWLIAILASKNEWDNLAAARQLAGAEAPKVDIIHGTEDDIVPHHLGEALAAHLQELGVPTSFKSVKADHNSLLSERSYGKWLRKVMKQ